MILSVNIEVWQIIAGLVGALGIPSLITYMVKASQSRKDRELDHDHKMEQRQLVDMDSVRKLLQAQIDELKITNKQIVVDAAEREAKYQELIEKLRHEIEDLVRVKNSLLVRIAELEKALQITLHLLKDADPENEEFIKQILDANEGN